jgi:hypothetical protein
MDSCPDLFRIITLAQAPFKVVQVNAAFLRLANATSTGDFLGKPLRELTVGPSVEAALQESLASLQTVVVPGGEHFRKTKNLHQRVAVFPVGTPGPEVKLTHFAVKLRVGNDKSPSCSSSVSSNTASFRNCKPDSTPVFAMG